MKSATILRTSSSDQGTLGMLVTDGFDCCTIELPWRDNQPNVSCIPSGSYEANPYHSRKFGLRYKLDNVDGRSYILIHPGNLAGNEEKGYKTHSQGCILLGNKFGFLDAQRAVLISRPTVSKFQEMMGMEPFVLNIFDFF